MYIKCIALYILIKYGKKEHEKKSSKKNKEKG